MPSFRSTAEAEVRDAVVGRLRQLRPDARIIHEINTSGTGSCRVDILAVCVAEIIAVEIKSERDTLSRLPAQIEAMRGASHWTIVALHEKHLRPNEHSILGLPKEPNVVWSNVLTWVYPETPKVAGRSYRTGQWEQPRQSVTCALPDTALEMLWADELRHACAAMRVPVSARTTRADAIRALRWHATGREITHAICHALRTRQCPEADAPMRTLTEEA